MSSDEALRAGVQSQDQTQPGAQTAQAEPEQPQNGAAPHANGHAQDSEQSPTASPAEIEAMSHAGGAGVEVPPAAEAQPEQPQGAADAGASETPSGEEPRRRVRLNPTVNEDAIKARPNVSAAAPHPPKVQVGGLSDDAPPPAEGAAESGALQEKPAEEAPRPARPKPVEIPSAKEALDPELEAEIAAALSSGELEAAAAAPKVEEAGAAPAQAGEENLEPGTKLRGKIQSIHGDDVFLDLGFRSPGVVQLRQFEANKKPQAGQIIEVVFDKFDATEGLLQVSLPKGIRKVAANWEAVSVGQIVDCMVAKTNKGGLEVTISNLRGFLPASQVDLHFVSDLEPFVGQKLRVQVTEVNPKKRNLVVSRRAYLQIERQEAEENIWKTLSEGAVFTGRVKTIKDYGAFVDIGGVDGFLHIGEISWNRINHPSAMLKEGQTVEVKVISLDPEKKKISLGMKQLTQNPWATATDRYAVGSTVSGRVTRTTDFGAFVELEPGVEGLVHISELDHRRVRRVTEVLKEGQTTEAKVLEVDPAKKRISLSVKALTTAPTPPSDEDLAPGAGQPYVPPKRKSPLKGGKGPTATGGGLFGNPDDYNR